jgi:hypothetical protein
MRFVAAARRTALASAFRGAEGNVFDVAVSTIPLIVIAGLDPAIQSGSGALVASGCPGQARA